MSLARATGLESVKFSAPDLDRMQDFLADFGLHRAEDSGDGVLRMRGEGSNPFVHETELGEPGFVGLTLRVSSEADLEALAARDGGQVEPAKGPGGGSVVALRDPDGYLVEAVYGRKASEPRPEPVVAKWNVGRDRARSGEAKRIVTAPAHILRLGHVVMGVVDLKRTWTWWHERFGLIVTDEVRAPSGDVTALFIRCDCGSEAVDHHMLNFATIPGVPPKFHHAAFEVLDLDDLMAGNQYLKDRGHQHDWGVGRHILGSQVFDYWKDPWGNRVEHWTDGDVFDASVGTNVVDLPTMLGLQWGPKAPEGFAA